MDPLQVDLYWIFSLLSGNKLVPVRLVAMAEDPRCAVVAPTSFRRLFWWGLKVEHGGLAFVSVVCHGRGDIFDPQVSFLAFSYSLHYFGPCLNLRYTRNILALEIW